MSDSEKKDGKKKAKPEKGTYKVPGYRQGGVVVPDQVKQMSAAARSKPNPGYAGGGMIPPEAGSLPPTPPGPIAGAPMGAPGSDTVPINATNGEFMVPATVVSYLGQKFFQDLIAKAMTEMGGPAAGGQPPNPFPDLAGPQPGEMGPM